VTSRCRDDDAAGGEQSPPVAAPITPAETLVAEKGDFEGDWKFKARYSVDARPFIEHAAEHRALDEAYRNRKSELRRYARLDPVTCMKIRHEYGIDIYNLKPGEGRRLMQIIDREFPMLKTTNMRETRRLV